jgi:glycosyltransferase involved in cell wall biosynthesis
VKVLHFLGIGRLRKRPMIDATSGTERSALEIAKIRTRRGHDVAVASMADDNWLGVRLLHLKPYSWARFRFLGKVRDLRLHLPLALLIRSGGFDLIHLHEYLRTRFFAGRPKVMHFHNNPLADQNPSEFAENAPEYCEQVGQRSAQIAVSEFVAGRLRLAHEQAGSNAPPANIVKVLGGADSKVHLSEKLKRERARIRKILGLMDTDVLFLFAGAIRPEKSVDYLAWAFARLPMNMPTLVWPSPTAASFGLKRDGCKEKSRGGRTTSPGDSCSGNRQEPRFHTRHRAACGNRCVLRRERYLCFTLDVPGDVCTGSSRGSVGLPVIAFRSGGIPELVENRRNGIVIAQGDEDALYQSMQELMLDRDLRDRLGSAAESVRVRFPGRIQSTGSRPLIKTF